MKTNYQQATSSSDQSSFPFHEYFWWLVRVTLVIGLAFLPQNFGLVAGPTNTTCFVNVHGMVILLTGGGDNQNCFNLLQSRVVGIQKLKFTLPANPSHLFPPVLAPLTLTLTPLAIPSHLYLLPGCWDPKT